MHLNEHTTEMMAEKVTIHFVDKEGWGDYAAYVYDTKNQMMVLIW